MDYGNSTFDVRHNLTASYVYTIPVGTALHGVMRNVLRGWQVNGIASYHTGLPFSVENGFDRAHTLQPLAPPNGSERPNLKPGSSNNPVLGKPERWFDPEAFELQPDGAFGNLGRNTARGPRLASLDAGLFRVLNFAERYSCELRFETFNVFNHPNFAVPDFPNREVFLDSSGTVNPRVGQITRTVNSSRQLQFAVRLNF